MDDQQNLRESTVADALSPAEAPGGISLSPTQAHEGKLLQGYLELHHLSTEEMAKKLDVTRQAVYLQMKRMYLSTRFKKKLSELGLFPFNNQGVEFTALNNHHSDLDSADRKVLIEEIRRLQNIVVLQAEHIGQMAKIK